MGIAAAGYGEERHRRREHRAPLGLHLLLRLLCLPSSFPFSSSTSRASLLIIHELQVFCPTDRHRDTLKAAQYDLFERLKT